MKTFRNYLSRATHYTSPDNSQGGPEAQREQFIRYCEAHGLDREFVKLVERCPDWKRLAENVPVRFFEEVYNLTKFSGSALPNIHIFCAEQATVPVIKLLLKSKTEYMYSVDQ